MRWWREVAKGGTLIFLQRWNTSPLFITSRLRQSTRLQFAVSFVKPLCEIPVALRALDRHVLPVSEPQNITAALHGLDQWLKREQRSGKSAVWLPEETLQRLRELPHRIRPAVSATEAPPAQPTATPAPTPPATAVAAATAPSPTANVDQPKRDRLNALARAAKRDTECRALGTLRETMVFATGNPDADLMFVGEAPGYEEEQQKKPFVGPAGQLLTKILGAMGLQRDDVYISNIVKFRPMIDDGTKQGRSNRQPSAEEMALSVKYVRAEIEIVAPKVIVALGGTAAAGLLGLDDGVGKLRGRFHDLDGTPAMVTYHPAYLLHQEKQGPAALKAEKKKVWDDMQLVLAKLGV